MDRSEDTPPLVIKDEYNTSDEFGGQFGQVSQTGMNAEQPLSKQSDQGFKNEKDVCDVLEKLCNDVVKAEEYCLIRTTEGGVLNIKVTQQHFNLANHFGCNSFSYIELGLPSIPTSKLRHSSKRKKPPEVVKQESPILRESPVQRKTPSEDSFEPIIKKNREDDSRVRVRVTFSDVLRKRCTFHDIEISEKRVKELSYQVEYDLFEFVKSVRDVRYRNWCRNFIKFVMNSGKVFLDKLLSGSVTTLRLVRIPDRILDVELHKMDEIEPAVEIIVDTPAKPDTPNQRPTQPIAVNTVNEAKSKVNVQASFPFKYRAEPLKSAATAPTKPVKTGRSAIDEILGTNKDTTSKHMSHLYDANCDICKRNTQMESAMMEKMKKNKQEKERVRVENLKSKTSDKLRMSPDSWRDLPDERPSVSPEIESWRESAKSRPCRTAERESWKVKANNQVKKTPESESWKVKSNDQLNVTSEPEPLSFLDSIVDNLVWEGLFTYPKMFNYKCKMSLVKNKSSAMDLRTILPNTMKVRGLIKCKDVWEYLESLRSAWTKQIITLLMHPPEDDLEYKEYVKFYQYLQESDRMTVIDVEQCAELKDVYLFALPPSANLHPSCNVGEGPGLSTVIKASGNILAVVVKHSGQRNERLSDSKSTNFDNRTLIEEKPVLVDRPLSDEKTPIKKEPFLDDIPILGKSPFDVTPEKSPFSAQSFSRENSLPNEPLFFNQTPFLTQTKPMFTEPALTDDSMDMSPDEEGEIVSPVELPPPPPPPEDLGAGLPPPPPPRPALPPRFNVPLQHRMPLTRVPLMRGGVPLRRPMRVPMPPPRANGLMQPRSSGAMPPSLLNGPPINSVGMTSNPVRGRIVRGIRPVLRTPMRGNNMSRWSSSGPMPGYMVQPGQYGTPRGTPHQLSGAVRPQHFQPGGRGQCRPGGTPTSIRPQQGQVNYYQVAQQQIRHAIPQSQVQAAPRRDLSRPSGFWHNVQRDKKRQAKKYVKASIRSAASPARSFNRATSSMPLTLRPLPTEEKMLELREQDRLAERKKETQENEKEREKREKEKPDDGAQTSLFIRRGTSGAWLPVSHYDKSEFSFQLRSDDSTVITQPV